MTDVAQDGVTNPFDSLLVESNEQKKETSAASSADDKQAETTPSQEGVKAEAKTEEKSEVKAEANIPDVNEKLPLNKDKRFKEIRSEKIALEKRIAEMQQAHSKELAEVKALIQNSQKTAKSSEIPAAFKKIFGDVDEATWKEWQSLFPAQQEFNVEDLKAQLMGELEKKQAQQSENQKKQIEWVEDQLESLKEEGLKFDRNELLKVLEDYSPTDANGMLDFKKGYQLLELMNKTKPANQRNSARKTLAANTTPQGVAEPASADTVDVSKARSMGWDWRKLSKY